MDWTARFRADLAANLPEGLASGTPLALAVSGGPDSMALLWLAHSALPGRVIAATVDHGLRPASAQEAALVARTCAMLGVPHATLHPKTPIAAGNLHAAARAARYALLEAWATDAGATVLATAHQLDDQAETFLMRAVRGAGPAGLAGVRRRRVEGGLTVIRPLLGWRRAELAEVVTSAGLECAADPSNTDERFERARVRRLLAEQPWLDPAGLAAAARHAGEVDAALTEMAALLWRDRATLGDPLRLDVTGLPRELRRRLARRAVAMLAPQLDPAVNVEPLLDALEGGRPATQGAVLVSPAGDEWRFTLAPARRPAG
jgi:tRNA(Ile)-lysidine synthase